MRKLNRRISEIEEELEDIESREQEINEAMMTTNEATQLMDLQKELDAITNQQDILMLEWEQLSEQLDK